MSSERCVLLTGFPSNELARRVLPALLDPARNARVTLLVPERFVGHASEWLSALPASQRLRTEVILGDVAWIDLGLSGREYLELAARVHVVHHCATVTYSGAPFEQAEKCNVGGTFEVLEFARQCRVLERVVHWSTLGATNDRAGVVYEDELVDPRSNPLAQTRYRAEKLVAKARAEVPVTVLRPSLLVGDSRTGRLARIEGAHLLIQALLNAPRDVPIFRPAHGSAQLQVVPIDYAVEAGMTIADAAESIGHNYHVVDHAALSLDEALSLIADLLGKPQPRGGLPPMLAQALLRIPGVDRLAHAQRALIDELGTGIRYDDRNAAVLLERAGLRCPSFASYVGKLVAHVERERKVDRPSASYSLLR